MEYIKHCDYFSIEIPIVCLQAINQFIDFFFSFLSGWLGLIAQLESIAREEG